jgi:D-glycero-D-manno-heptose 1,7-bisphosphate phosphatase
VIGIVAKAIFFDKDGTLIPDIAYNTDPAKIVFNFGAGIAISKLSALGFLFIVVSNQSGVARGYFTEEDLIPVREKLESLFLQSGAKLDGFYYCPHYPWGSNKQFSIECDCRKPQPGMILRAAREHRITLEESWIIGDILNDVEAGNKAGCRTILLNNGNETEWLNGEYRIPDYIADDLVEAADIILAELSARGETVL